MPLECSPRKLFPADGVHGAKVWLQPFVQADITDRYLGWLNDPQVVRFSNQRFRKHDMANSRSYLASFDGTDNLFLSVRRADTGVAVGTLTVYVTRHHGTADVGILIGDTTVWGLGLGQDAWDTISNWLLQHANVRKITAGTLACNHGMLAVMKRSGMHYEATRMAQEIVAGQAEDIVYYARFRAA
jgi:ribosomal-protein-alanine N-acetyltransferase